MTQPNRPTLNKNISLSDFQQFYWEKIELIQFCRKHGLSTQGSKLEITERIQHFLQHGGSTSPLSISKGKKDSERGTLRRSTPVVHYKSDPPTRAFFCREIGPHFKFNADVLTWIKTKIKKGESFTYGDIIQEWNRIFTLKQDPNYIRKIPKQFQFNQFMRDWKAAKAGAGAQEAWAWMRSLPGEPTYARYVQMKKN